jgi:hypothetical protein
MFAFLLVFEIETLNWHILNFEKLLTNTIYFEFDVLEFLNFFLKYFVNETLLFCVVHILPFQKYILMDKSHNVFNSYIVY